MVGVLYSHTFVRFVRVLFCVLLLCVVSYAIHRLIRHAHLRSFSSKVMTNILIEPTFTSIDTKGRPYEISAQRAREKIGQKSGQHYQVVKPKARMIYDKNTPIFLEGKTGIYQKQDRKLLLEGDVRIDTVKEGVLQTPQAFIDFRTKTIAGVQRVNGKSLQGSFEASKGFHLADDVLTLQGPCHVSLTLQN
jgi:hypothetical protein